MSSSRAVLLCFTLIAAAACEGTVIIVSPSGGLFLSVSLSDTTVARSTPATLRLRLENQGGHEQTIRFNSSCQIMPYIARRDTGGVVYPEGGAWMCATALSELQLAAHGATVREYQLKTDAASTAGVVVLPPGEYLAYAKLEPPNTLQSNSIQFTVR